MNEPIEWHIIKENIQSEAENYNHLMHLATYNYVIKYVLNKRVLDYGCGSGYGSFIQSKYAKSVIGVDINKDAIEMAKKKYQSDNLNYSTIAELDDNKFDVITSFQVIEHVPNVKAYLTFLKSLLNPGGIILISTPDKKNRLFNYIQNPWNEHHLTEYSFKKLSKLIHQHFNSYEMLKIGSNNKFALEEIKRTQKQRLISLGATLVIYPNFLRVFLLRLLTQIYSSIFKSKKSKEISTNQIENNFIPRYKMEDIVIADQVKHSTEFFVKCMS